MITLFSENEKYHLIFATHSPFIISDLPKENIIFLEKGKQVYPFEDGKQTFGANIHTLLSHGFFMKDGLMGEFAKDKIKSIINYHEEIKELNEAISSSWKKPLIERIIIPIVSTVGGYYGGGYIGSAIGFSSSIVSPLIDSFNKEKHPLSYYTSMERTF